MVFQHLLLQGPGVIADCWSCLVRGVPVAHGFLFSVSFQSGQAIFVEVFHSVVWSGRVRLGGYPFTR